MKKILIALFSLMFIANAQTTEARSDWDPMDIQTCDSYSYFTLGVGPVLILPSAGVGYKSHMFHHGFDVSLSYSTVIQAHMVQAITAYQFYPNPFRNDPWYIGVGAATTYGFTNCDGGGFSVAPDLCVGKERITRSGEKHFLEMHVQAPTWIKYARIDFPFMYIKYGVSF